MTNTYRNTLRGAYILWAIAIIAVVLNGGRVDSVPEPRTPAPVTEEVKAEPVPATIISLDYAAVNVEAAEPESPFYREDIPLEYELQEALYAACTETGIRYELALAVVKKETDFRNVVGDGGESYGYMQVQPKWHSERMERLGVDDLMDPAGNFRVGCDYLAELLEKYDLPEALTAYNTGSPGHNQYADTVIGYMEDFT